MVAICLVLVSALSAIPVSAQGSAAADTKEIQAYKLTVPAMKQFVVASRNMMAAIKQDPRYIQLQKLQDENKALADKEEPNAADEARMEKLQADIDRLEESAPKVEASQSLSDMERAIQQEPLIANALKSAGMTGREYRSSCWRSSRRR